jgi:small subunit ribosomal protein S7
MSLKYRSTSIYIKPDPVFRSLLASKIINNVMLQGKKSIAERIFYKACERLQKRIKGKEAIEIVETAINNIKPMVETKSRRVGGSNYQVPVPVSKKRSQALAIRWIVGSARDKKGKAMWEKLSDEIFDAYNATGSAHSKKENIHKMAESNKAFAHLAW